MIYVNLVFVTEKSGRYWATPERLRQGENIIPYCEHYRAKIAHVCESATKAHQIAQEWNEQYKKNGTNLY